MVATTTTTDKGLSIKVADSDFTLVSILADIDMRTGTPVDETAWLDGNSGGSYPGTLTGFNAKNVDGKANGSLRMVTFTGADNTVAPLATGGLLPCLIVDSEVANQVVQITVLLLN